MSAKSGRQRGIDRAEVPFPDGDGKGIFLHHRDKMSDIGRVVLAIGIDGYHVGHPQPARRRCGCQYRCSFTKISGVAHNMNVESNQGINSAVRTAIVNDHNLIVDFQRTGHDPTQSAAMIVDRDDNDYFDAIR